MPRRPLLLCAPQVGVVVVACQQFIVGACFDDPAVTARAMETSYHKAVTSDKVTNCALEFLDAQKDDDKPFFLFLHYFG